MTDVLGRRCELDPTDVRSRLSELLGAHSVDTDGPVSVLVDGHYPFHPSTGLVTNPSVVTAAVDSLRNRGATVRLRCPSAGQFTPEQCVTYLRYEDVLDRQDVELAGESRETVDRTVRVGGEDVALSLAAPLVSGTVLSLPTLRKTGSAPSAPALALTARCALGREPTPDETAAVAAACGPDLSVLDGTYVFVGRPRSAGFLLASADGIALDRAGTWIAGVSPPEVPALDRWEVGSRPPTVDGVDADALREAVGPPDDGAPAGSQSPVVEYGYRIYSRVSGDLVPPQFLQDPQR
jgi:uncharacterized protein (DUF362 family)